MIAFTNEQVYKLLEDANHLFERFDCNQVCSFELKDSFYVVFYFLATNSFDAFQAKMDSNSSLENLIFKIQNTGEESGLDLNDEIKKIEYILNKSRQHYFDAH
ncbi:MAG: hypothetical protein JNL69_12410 [Bacteroidia bacterium]|nr:hypothetical protein [Bacteroidia bacterium]